MKRGLSIKITLCLYILFIWAALVKAQEKLVIETVLPVESSQDNDLADENAIQKIINQWKDGYNSGEAAKVVVLYAENAYYLT